MRAADFNSVPTKKNARGARKHALPVVAATVEVFICRPQSGARLTRVACARMAENPPTIGPCGKCLVGQSHLRGRLPGTWPSGEPIEFLTIHVPGTRSPTAA